MTEQQPMIIPTATRLEVENVPEIQALTTRANELSGSVDWWNTAMIWALVFAAVAAIAVVLTTRVALFRARQLGDVQGALIRSKDAQLTLDLRAKDEKISGLDLDSTKAKQDLAGLQKAASDAKAAQQRVETDLAKQQEKTATAERALLQLQRRMEPRRILADQKTRVVELLSRGPKAKVQLSCVLGDSEGKTFANDIDGVLKASGWETTGVSEGMYSGGNPVGLFVQVHDAATAPASAVLLQQAFFSIGMPLRGAVVPSLQEGTIEILVGNKPQ